MDKKELYTQTLLEIEVYSFSNRNVTMSEQYTQTLHLYRNMEVSYTHI